MEEVIKHSIGICGDGWHPSLLNLSFLSAGILYCYHYIKFKIKSFINYEQSIDKK